MNSLDGRRGGKIEYTGTVVGERRCSENKMCEEMQMLEKICWMRCECLQYASNKKVVVVVVWWWMSR